jgi:FeS assembly SUF system protein
MSTVNPQSMNETLEAEIIKALRSVYDPEIPVNIYDLGLIYKITIQEDNAVHIQMTLTTPGCPVAATFPQTVEHRVREVAGVNEVTVELVWDPPWSNENMSESAKLALGLL